MKEIKEIIGESYMVDLLDEDGYYCFPADKKIGLLDFMLTYRVPFDIDVIVIYNNTEYTIQAASMLHYDKHVSELSFEDRILEIVLED